MNDMSGAPFRHSAVPPAVHGHDLLRAVLHEPPAVEYQPIKGARTLKTLGHEALARFSVDGRPLAPDRVFVALHDNPLLFHFVELKWKRLQIELAPADGLLFVNLDPDAWAEAETPDGRDAYLELFAPQRERLVVEVIENMNLHDVALAQRISSACTAAGLRIALDDVSSSKGIVSFAALADAHYMKFDRSWLFAVADGDGTRLALLEYALSFSRRFALTTVLEGVETEEHLAWARRFGFDCVQGFLFRDEFLRRTAGEGR